MPTSSTADATSSFELESTDDLARLTHEDLRRNAWRMVVIRYVAAGFAVTQVLVYGNTAPGYVGPLGLALAAAIAVANTGFALFYREERSTSALRRLAMFELAFDVLLSISFVWLYSFDHESAHWAILFIVPLEGAVRFQLAGALTTWGAVTVLYDIRERWKGEVFYPEYVHEYWSVSYRMGIALLIALVVGFMASDLNRRRTEAELARTRLERTDQLRRNLVSVLAHDVRTPLTGIRGPLAMLLRRPDMDPTIRASLVRTADSQAARLQYLAADLLDLARLEDGRLEVADEPLDVREVVDKALASVDTGEAFDVRVPEGLGVRGDAARLEQVLVNLAVNALRHGSPPFAVEASVAEERVRLEVCDGGDGIPEDRRTTLFHAWSSGDRTAGSVGLGLWIVRLLVEAQGGEVDYRHTPDQGSHFVLELPLETADEPAVEAHIAHR